MRRPVAATPDGRTAGVKIERREGTP